MSSSSLPRARWHAVALLAVLIAGAYGTSVTNEFVFDDLMFVQDDPRVQSLSQAPRLFVEPLWGYADRDSQPRLHQYYRPLQTFPLALSHAAFGAAAWPCHLLSLLLHFLNCVLVLEILRRLLGQREPAALGAALFAVHPGYSEAVFWTSDFAGLGAAACTLSIFSLHLTGMGRRWYGRLATALLFLCGLWFKESGILAPLLLMVYDLLLAPDRGWRRLRRMLGEYAVFVPPFAVYAVLRLHALGSAVPGLQSVPLTSWDLVLNAVALLPQYVATFLWPFNLSMYHDFSIVHGLGGRSVQVGCALIIAGAAVVLATVRSHPPVAFGLVWALVTASPFLLIRWPQLNVFAERYLYLPAVGFFLVLAYLFGQSNQLRQEGIRPQNSRFLKRLMLAAATVWLAVCIVTDLRRAGDWHDDVTLYSKTLKQSPHAALIRINLAVKLYERGRYDEGIAWLEPLVTTDPEWQDAWYNLGLLYLAKGTNDKALAAFEQAWRTNPQNRPALLNLGYLYDRTGRRAKAVKAYLRLVKMDPANRQGWYNLATIAFEHGQFGNARAAVQRVLAVSPQDADARALLVRLDRLADSRRVDSNAVRADTMRRCARAKRAIDGGRYAGAIRVLQMAAWLDEASPVPHQYLANVYVLTGRLEAAIDEQRATLQRAPNDELYQRNLLSLERALAAQTAPNRIDRR